MIRTNFSVPSSDNIHTLAGVVYLPEKEVKGFFHIVHGMTEHMGRYDRIMTDMAEEGYVCFGYDNLGHGHTARDESELGYIAKKDGHELLARDVKLFSDAVRDKYGYQDKELPYYLMGHSMGSFITRYALEKYVKPTKYIIMGTGGKNPAAGAGLALISLVKLFRGDRYISPLIDKLAFGSYNKRFGGGTKDNPSPWLTSDISIREKYFSDGFCSFKFTVSAMGDLIRLNKITNRGAWFKNIPKDVPVLLISGENDPVGDYGKGIVQVYEGLKKQGVDAEYILYPDGRHEILNDITYEQTKTDILKFIDS